MPGRVGDALSAGCNRLIRQGAGLAESPEEFVAELGLNSLQTVNKCKKNKNSLAKEENMLYSCVDLYPVGLNELIERTGLSLQEISSALVELELEGKIEEVAGNCYARKYS